ncbi:MAG: ABC transporter permease [Longimicrobiales bacterium]
MIQDVRYGLRTLVRSPVFTLAAIATLAIGIGANTTIFSLVNAVLLRPPAAVAAPDELVAVYTSDFSGPLYGASSFPDYEAFRTGTAGVLSDVAAYTLRPVTLVERGETRRVLAELVSPNYFEALGVRLPVGRGFTSAEGRPGAAGVAVVSYALWQSALGGGADVLGRELHLNGGTFTIIGVAPAGFNGALRLAPADLWVPVPASAEALGASRAGERGNRGLFVLGRLADGASVDEAQARLDVLARQLYRAYPAQWENVRGEGRTVTVLPERETRIPPMMRGPALGFLGLLFAVVGLLLLLCCANVANLLLARATRRTREIAVRLSLGARRARLARQLLTESLVLALLGGAAGVLLAFWASDALLSFRAALPIQIALDLSPDARVLGFALAATLVTGLLFGLAPALQATRPDVVRALKEETPQPGSGRARLRGALVVGQIAISLVLLVGAGLFLRSLQEAANANLGFDPDGVLVASLDLESDGYTEETRRQFHGRLARRLEALPGVEAVALARDVPLSAGWARRGISVEGYEPAEGEDMEFHSNIVGPGYLETMRVPLVRGREFTAADRTGAPGVIIVNEAFARRFWPDEDPLGKRIGRGDQTFEVIGVTRTGKYRMLSEEPTPYFYLPYLQVGGEMTLHVRAAGELADLARLVRAEIRALDPDTPILGLEPIHERTAFAVLPQRVGAALLGLFSIVALLLAGIGLYGVMAFGVGQRTREIGIRIALGARPRDVVRMILRQGLRLSAVGLGIGLLASAALTRLISGFLYGVGAFDATAFAAVAVLLAAVALLATYLPARRATRIDPVGAIRSE